ncbi:MAG: response regulator transcription factor [Rhodothermaceae bacterium]|nr:response regulator transcription factor [Rhodothermaceae bacterium]
MDEFPKYRNNILLVEDEAESADMLANFLEMQGYRVFVAYDGDQALRLLGEKAGDIHLAILDIMVPGTNGHEICRKIRSNPVTTDIPVIFLTARDQEKDEIDGLSLGADDYIAKPASLNLILAHVKTLLRRQAPEKSNWLIYGTTCMDMEAREVYQNNTTVDLTNTEFRILELFFQNPRRIFSRQDILEHISGDDRFVFDRTVDVHVKNLRLKLDDRGDLIKTHRGVGYGLNKELAVE